MSDIAERLEKLTPWMKATMPSDVGAIYAAANLIRLQAAELRRLEVEVARVRADKDAAYAERNRVVAAALADLTRAIEFFDLVKTSTAAEKAAVGSDHWDWLQRAAREVVAAAKVKDRQYE